MKTETEPRYKWTIQLSDAEGNIIATKPGCFNAHNFCAEAHFSKDEIASSPRYSRLILRDTTTDKWRLREQKELSHQPMWLSDKDYFVVQHHLDLID